MVSTWRSLEIQQLEEFLKREFVGSIQGIGQDAEKKERNFLSKAAAAYFLMVEAGASKPDAVAASIDGGGDHGVDSVYVSPTNVIWLVQSKYKHEGTGEPSLGEAGLFRDGVNDFVAGKFDRFNQALAAKLPQVKTAMDGPHQIAFALVYTGTSMDESRRTMFGEVESAINDVQPGRARFIRYGLSDFHEAQIKQHGEPDIDNIILELHNYGISNGVARTYYGALKVKDLAALYQTHGHALVRANIRRYKGASDVNEGMTRTLREKADHFFCFNNGVTFLCRSILAVGGMDHQTHVKGRFRLNGVSIINGAQTAGTVAQEPLAHYDAQPAEVLVTCIVLPEDEGTFADAVTEYRNSQNAVKPQDFVAMDDNQESWRRTLAAHGVTYIYKPSVTDAQVTAPLFTVEEAARFRAARDLRGLNLIFHQPEKLWDRRKDFQGNQPTNDSPSVYKVLFSDILTSRNLWRTTQIGRQIQEAIQQDADSMPEPLDAEYARQSIWLVTHIALVRLKELQDGVTLTLTQDEQLLVSQEINAVRTAVANAYETIKMLDTPIAETFVDMTCLQAMKTAAMQALQTRK